MVFSLKLLSKAYVHVTIFGRGRGFQGVWGIELHVQVWLCVCGQPVLVDMYMYQIFKVMLNSAHLEKCTTQSS